MSTRTLRANEVLIAGGEARNGAKPGPEPRDSFPSPVYCTKDRSTIRPTRILRLGNARDPESGAGHSLRE